MLDVALGIKENKILEQTKASFYIYCQKIHEDSIELWKKQIEGNSLENILENTYIIITLFGFFV